MGSSESRRKIAARIELFSKTAVLGQRGQCLVRQVPTKGTIKTPKISDKKNIVDYNNFFNIFILGIKIACDDRRARS